MQFNPLNDALDDNVLKNLVAQFNTWADAIEDRPSGEDFLDDMSLFFVYAMAKFMVLERNMSENKFDYLREGIDLLSEKLAEYGANDTLLANVFAEAIGQQKAPEPETTDDGKVERYTDSQGQEVVVQYG